MPDKVIFRLMWSVIEHTCNNRTDLRVLLNRSSLNIVMQSWGCWPMCKYCPIFISWLKQKGKKVQDPVLITSNWINILINTPANPLIPGQWVCWESTFTSWWSSKVWSPFWYCFLCQTLPEIPPTANCIVLFWIRRCFWFWEPFSKSSSNGKMIGFLIERCKSSG